MIGTFALVLFFTMVKEAYEVCVVIMIFIYYLQDFSRYKQDREVNNKITLVYNPDMKRFEETKWRNVKIGNIVKFRKDLELSSDILVLYSSNKSGLVYVDTMNLDGETNLKEKTSLLEKLNEDKIFSITGEMTCDLPNEILDFWDAQITIQNNGSGIKIANIKNLLLRGCFVKNTDYGIGIVVYTGMDTKIYRNLKKAPYKVSNVMKLMNKMLYTIFVFQIFIISLYAGLSLKWTSNNQA